MEHEFWHHKWQINEIGFHEGQPNAMLQRHFKSLSLEPGHRVFVPLCGKTVDICWLLSRGVQVVGIELSELAVKQFFEEQGIEADIEERGDLKCFNAPNLEIFVGDIFALDKSQLRPVDAIYDRAALVALPESMRVQYTQHLREISDNAQQLLIAFDYDQNAMAGPPFSIPEQEIAQHYRSAYTIQLLESVPVEGGLKGQCPANENIWLLNKL